MANNLIIKDGNNTARTIHTIEDSTSAHFNMSIPIDVSGHAVAMVTNGQTVASTMNAMVVAQRDGLPAGANLIGSVSISPNGLNIPVSVANTPAVTQSGTWNVGVNAGTNLMGAVSVRQIVSVQPDGTANWPVSVAGTIAATQSGTWGINVNGAIVSTNNLATINAVNGSLYTIAQNYAWDGTVWRIMSSDTSGRLNVNANTSLGGSTALIGSVSISPNGLNIPVSVAPPTFNIPVSIAPAADKKVIGAVSIADSILGTIGIKAGTAQIGAVSVNQVVTVAPQSNFIAALPAGGFAVGGEVSSANGTFTSGHLAPLQLDANGRLKISGTITGGSMTQTVGAAVTTEGYPMLGSDGTNARRMLTTTGGALVVHVSNSQPAVATSIAGMVTVMPAANFYATLPAGGFPIGGEVSSANPVITAGQFAPLQLDTSGRLKIAGTLTGGSMTQTVGAAVTTEGYPMLGSDGTNARSILTTTGGAVVVHVSNLQPAVSVAGIVSVQPDGTANWPVSVANTPAVTQSGTWNVGINAGTNLIGAVSVRGTIIGAVSIANIADVSISPAGLNIPVSVANIPAVSQSGTWTVQPGNTANTTPWLVSVNSNIAVSVQNTLNVSQSGTWNVGVNAGTNLMGAVSVRQIVSVQPDGTANWPVSVAGTAAVTQSGTWTVQPGNTPNTAPWLFTEVPTSVDGLTPITTLISAYTSGYLVKGAAGKVYSVQGFNNAATPLYLRLFNKATAPAASDAPYIVFMIPGNTAGAGFVYSVPTGIAFGTGIGWRISGGINSTDATAPTDNQGIVNIFYK